MKQSQIVAEYDYYTLEQARQIIRQEQRQKARQKRIERVETIKEILVIGFFMIGCPLLMFLHWLAFGY